MAVPIERSHGLTEDRKTVPPDFEQGDGPVRQIRATGTEHSRWLVDIAIIPSFPREGPLGPEFTSYPIK